MFSQKLFEGFRGDPLNKLSTYYFLTPLFLPFAIALVILFWGVDRGIDLRDEGFSLLCTEHPSLCPHPSSFAFFISKLPWLSSNPIISLRIDAIVLQLSSAIMLIIGCQCWMRSYLKIESGILLGIFICTVFSSLLCFSIFGATLNYNGLTTFFILAAEACLFGGLASTKRSELNAPIFLTLSGGLLGFGLFAKFSAGVVFYGITICTIAVLSEHARLKRMLWHFLGMVLGIALFFILIEPWSVWFPIFKTMVFDIELGSGGSHGAGLLDNTLYSLKKHYFEIILVVLAMIGQQALAPLLTKVIPNNNLLRVVAPSACVLVVLVSYWLHYIWVFKWLHSSIVYWPVAFVLLSFVICFGAPSQVRFKTANVKVMFSLLVMAITPLVTSLGTDTPMLWHALVNMSPLYLSVGYASYMVGSQLGNAAYVSRVLFLMICVVSLQFFYGYVIAHKEIAPLYYQTELMTHPLRFSGMRLEPKIANLLQSEQAILVKYGFVEGDPILGLYDTPGLVYAVGGISPGFAWYGIDQPNQAINDYFLPRLQIGRSKRLFVIIKNRSGSAVLDEHARTNLRLAGIDFPKDFEEIGEAFQPYTYGGRACHFFMRRQPAESSSP
ncbi:MAG: hypothetical protein U0103_28895 [Candidatus Obscuribacterales bacterium]